MSDHLTDWNDFEVYNVNTSEKTISSRELFDRYIFFRETFNKLPKNELVNRGWIDNADDMTALLPLLRDIQAGRNDHFYRKANTANEALCSVWLSEITTTAKLAYLSQDVPSFEGIDENYLKEFALLSVDENVIHHLPEILIEKGIILIYEKALPSMKLDGVVFKLESGTPVIGLSFRFSRLDNFWFTLMHELSHIVLHLTQLDIPIFDDLKGENNDRVELQANRLAKNSFVSRELWRNCDPKYDRSPEALISFAKQIGIHPAIIAGMLRKEENSYKIHSKTVNNTNIRKMIFGHD